jgi:hypothetical protein
VRNPSILVLERIAKALDVDVIELPDLAKAMESVGKHRS